MMQFWVTSTIGPPGVYLAKDGWNDWYTWYTLYNVFVVQGDGSTVSLGSVKIAREGMTEQDASTTLPQSFSALEPQYFSLGQSENYYETIASLGDDFRIEFLRAMRDVSYDLALYNQFQHELVMINSLTRDISFSQVTNRFNRLANGNSILTRYSFSYELPADPRALDAPPRLSFDVLPLHLPPTNVHVLIGRNGVGKSRCFDLLTRTLLQIPAKDGKSTGSITAANDSLTPWNITTPVSSNFSGIVSVSFSAFDSTRPFLSREILAKGLKYSYIGLKDIPNDSDLPPAGEEEQIDFPLKDHVALARDFVESVRCCRVGLRMQRWKAALETLETDPIFQEYDVSSLADDSIENWHTAAYRTFRLLSSGHGIVLLTITKLVELVDEKSLVLIDEPEGHLHPPLLAAFVRALSDLLVSRNGVAIVATHSPVVLQEVPKSCVWILSRSGASARADRPEIETFGENVGVLTREVFDLEVTQSGFHKMIAEMATKFDDYNQILEAFDGQLGAEGRGLARYLTLRAKEVGIDGDDSE